MYANNMYRYFSKVLRGAPKKIFYSPEFVHLQPSPARKSILFFNNWHPTRTAPVLRFSPPAPCIAFLALKIDHPPPRCHVILLSKTHGSCTFDSEDMLYCLLKKNEENYLAIIIAQ